MLSSEDTQSVTEPLSEHGGSARRLSYTNATQDHAIFGGVEEHDTARDPSNASCVDERRRLTSPRRPAASRKVFQAPIIRLVASSDNETSKYTSSTPEYTLPTPIEEYTTHSLLMGPLAAPQLDDSNVSSIVRAAHFNP